MGKASERKKQEKREKHKRKREQAKQRARAQAQARALPTTERGLVELASAGEFGPAWIREGWDTPAQANHVIPLIITRRLRGSVYLPHVVFVDRSCLGIKDASLLRPANEHELQAMLVELRAEDIAPVSCDVAVAQSIVFHALDFAASLGFEPHRDFHRRMFEPRPRELVDTAGARRERPSYWPDLDHDDPGEVVSVLLRLEAAVGRENYDYLGQPHAFNPYARALASPPDLGLHPADAGGDPERIDWLRACVGVEWAEPLLVDEDTGDWELTDHTEDLIWQLERGLVESWEAVLRCEQSLPLTAEQREITGQLGADDERVEFIDDEPRPCEPWYQTFDRLLDHLVLDRLSTTDPVNPERLSCGVRLVNAVEACGGSLSLPPGVQDLEQLLADERISRLRVQHLFEWLADLGQIVGGKRISLADPDQRSRVEGFRTELSLAREHFDRLGWSVEDWLDEQVDIPDDERRRLLDAIGPSSQQ